MIKTSSYIEDTAGLDFSQLPQIYQDGNLWMQEALAYYDKSKIVKRVADRFVKELNEAGYSTSTTPAPTKSEAAEAIEVLQLLLDTATDAERKEIEEAIEVIELLS